MSKISYENIRVIDELPDLDYSMIPIWVKKAISLEPEMIVKMSKLTWDGKQYSVRIPTEITTDMNIDKTDKIKFTMIRPLPDSGDELKLKIELVRSNDKI